MEYSPDDYLQLSGLQHFLFCRRQWALIHIEDQWEENFRTADGRLMHDRAHNEALTEKRGDVITARGVEIYSRSLGVSGKCDVLEFHRDTFGVPLSRWEGCWKPSPVEYKRGAPKPGNCDAAQLCGQAMCLEEMLCVDIPRGALFYGETRRRVEVAFTAELRGTVKNALEEMHEMYRRGHTPRAKPSKSCNACSLKERCLPKLARTGSVSDYIAHRMEEGV
ncbi:MAG: CRISPR-associated protein Cas4 [Oscillospiraceae bacterium]|nr:CRISPR-associated protein Cas4 [Oscillospiraceae bacterium]